MNVRKPSAVAPGNPRNHESDRGEHALDERCTKDAIDDRANRRSGNVEQPASFVPANATDRHGEPIRGGVSVSIKEKHHEQANDYLKETLAQRASTAEHEFLCRRQQFCDFGDTRRTALVEEGPV